MAEEVQISPDSIERTAKIRHPVAVPVLTVITLGIYGIYWWYQINREMVDLGKASERRRPRRERRPCRCWPSFPGPSHHSAPRLALQRGQAHATRPGGDDRRSHPERLDRPRPDPRSASSSGSPGLIVLGYIQSEMNKVWENVGARPGPAPCRPRPPTVPPSRGPARAAKPPDAGLAAQLSTCPRSGPRRGSAFPRAASGAASSGSASSTPGLALGSGSCSAAAESTLSTTPRSWIASTSGASTKRCPPGRTLVSIDEAVEDVLLRLGQDVLDLAERPCRRSSRPESPRRAPGMRSVRPGRP